MAGHIVVIRAGHTEEKAGWEAGVLGRGASHGDWGRQSFRDETAQLPAVSERAVKRMSPNTSRL